MIRRALPFFVSIILLGYGVRQHWASGQERDAVFPVAAIFSLTGFGAAAGQGELEAIQLAATEINAAGGIGGKRVIVSAEDNRSVAKETVTAFHKSMMKKPLVLLGPNWAEFAEVAAPLAERYHLPMLTPSASKKGLLDGKRYVFSVYPSHRLLITPFIEEVLSKQHKKIALFFTENAFYEELSQALKSGLDARGVRVWKEFSFKPEDQDYRAAVLSARSAGADLFIAFLLNNDGEIPNFLKQSSLAGLKREQLFFGPGLGLDEGVLTNKSMAEGVTFFASVSTPSADFIKKFTAATGRAPAQNEDKAYDLLFVVKSAVEQCGAAPEKLSACLHSRSFTGISGTIEFDEHGQIKQSTSVGGGVFVVEKGEFKRVR
jgi:branched-chain amino acid transport system substrate-binding protein